jgi:glyoxylase-like metal-dependent hydrolase (beta-lactamase superfamily II)
MKTYFFIFVALILGFITLSAAAQEDVKIEISVKKVSDRVIILTAPGANNNITAISSKSGMVVIDTGASPSMALLMRDKIVEHFGRDDFAYVINTHDHGDHTYGNQAFADALAVGHENCPKQMTDNLQSSIDQVPRYRVAVQRLKDRLAGMEAGSEAAKTLAVNIKSYEMFCDDLEGDFQLTVPAITFSDRMTLDLGDITLRLLYYGLSHANNDILILCPEEGILFTGDLFAKGITPYIDDDRLASLPRWLACLDEILAPESAVDKVIPGHGDLLTLEEMAGYHNYIAEQNVNLKGKRSAVPIFEKILREEGMEAAVEEFRRNMSETDKYFFVEPELNGLGYRLMGDENLEAAVEVFKFVVELYPDSWNAYDSLGEAYMVSGDKELAIQNYKKSLELNPENANAERRLKILLEDK